MKAKETTIWAIVIMAMVVIALIFGFALKASNESLAEADRTIAEADAFIASYEERSREYESITATQETEEVQDTEQTSVETESVTEFVEVIESYCDPTTVFYERPETDGPITWEDCVEAASAIGMDEYSLSIMVGWTVRESYIWYDYELALLCAYCPLHYWANGEDIAWGLSGYGSDPSYTDGNLVWFSYQVSGEELEVIYQALTNPRYDIYCCDGVSYYDYGCIYESYVNGYTIRVWAE